jgi:hypothetical protein
MFPSHDLSKQLTVSFLGLSLFGFLSLNVAAQAPTKSAAYGGPTEVTFHRMYVASPAPVKITHIMLGEKEVFFDTPVAVSGKWLRTLRVVVQNASPKVATAGSVMLQFPETGDGTLSKPILGDSFGLGRMSQHWYLKRDGSERPRGPEAQEPEISVLPGGSMTLMFKGANNANADQEQARAYELAGKLTRIDVGLGTFSFGDESRWTLGVFYIPVPPPTVWKQITPEEFFGGAPPGNR